MNKSSELQYNDRILSVVGLMEDLPKVSGGLLQDANQGEAYEVLVRRLGVLHREILGLAAAAQEIKVARLPVRDDGIQDYSDISGIPVLGEVVGATPKEHRQNVVPLPVKNVGIPDWPDIPAIPILDEVVGRHIAYIADVN